MKWFFEPVNAIKTFTNIADSRSITIQDIKLKDAGYYYCYGLYKNNPEPVLGRGQLKVYGKLLSQLVYINYKG